MYRVWHKLGAPVLVAAADIGADRFERQLGRGSTDASTDAVPATLTSDCLVPPPRGFRPRWVAARALVAAQAWRWQPPRRRRRGLARPPVEQARARMFARSRQCGALGNRQLRSGHTTNDFHRSARLGPPSGGTFVDLFGSNFVSGSTVTFDEVPATGVTLLHSTILAVTNPLHAAGTVAIVVRSPDGRPVGKSSYMPVSRIWEHR